MYLVGVQLFEAKKKFDALKTTMTRRSAAKTAEAVSGQPPSDQEAETDVHVQPIRIPTPDFQSTNDGAGKIKDSLYW